MDAKRLEELVAKCEKAASGSRHFVGDILTASDLHDLARCAAEVVLLRRVAVRAYMLLARIKEQSPQPPQSVAVNLARKQLQSAISAVEAAPAVGP